jgi:hypothetical protein
LQEESKLVISGISDSIEKLDMDQLNTADLKTSVTAIRETHEFHGQLKIEELKDRVNRLCDDMVHDLRINIELISSNRTSCLYSATGSYFAKRVIFVGGNSDREVSLEVLLRGKAVESRRLHLERGRDIELTFDEPRLFDKIRVSFGDGGPCPDFRVYEASRLLV